MYASCRRLIRSLYLFARDESSAALRVAERNGSWKHTAAANLHIRHKKKVSSDALCADTCNYVHTSDYSVSK